MTTAATFGDWWPCACVKGGGDGQPSTHLRLNAPAVLRCRECGATRSGAVLAQAPIQGRVRSRVELIEDLKRLRASIEQMFIDAVKWNDGRVDPVDPDPNGEMRKMADSIDAVLATDPGHGPLQQIYVPGRRQGEGA